MKDFDESFRDRLQESDETRRFPHADRNWRHLSRRLEAFDAGAHGHHVVRHLWVWKAAAAVAIIVAGLLGWHNHTLRTENIALRETSGQALDSLQKAAPVPAPEKRALPTSPTGLPGANQPIAGFSPAGQTGNETVPFNGPSYWQNTDSPSLTPAANNFSEKKNPRRAARTEAEKQWADAERAAKIAAARQAVANQPMVNTLPTNDPEVLARHISRLRTQLDSLQALAGIASPSADSTQSLLSQRDLAILDPLPTALYPARPSSTPTSAAIADGVPRAPAPPANTFTKPVHSPARFRIGAQALAGQVSPKAAGVSALTGQGIMAEARVFQRLWVTAAADWMRYDISADTYPTHFHLPYVMPPHDPGPGPGHDDYDLVQVESNQRQQRYAVGLRYALLAHGWVRPSIRVAHVWAQTSPAYVIYHFEEHQHGPGPGGNLHTEVRTEESEKQHFANIWRFGAGLEHESRRWSFGLWADYDKSFDASKPLFDVLTARASVAYQF